MVAALCDVAEAQLSLGGASEVITETRTALRRTPARTRAPLRTLPTGTRLAVVRPDSLRNDFYHVVTRSGDTGWVAFVFVRPVLPDTGASRTFLTAPPSLRIINAMNPAIEIDPSWEKPRIVRSTFRGKGQTFGNRRCAATGAPTGDWRTNERKNRNDYPTTSHAVTWDALASVDLPFADGGLPIPREDWMPDQAEQIAQFEGIPLTVVGYIHKIKFQGEESTNCGFTGDANTDWHVPFVGEHEQEEADAVVIEPTPRFKERHPNWRRPRLRHLEADRRDAGDSVRVTGFLFYDPSHEDHIRRGFRSTMWELHPITRIEVLRAGRWFDVDRLR